MSLLLELLNTMLIRRVLVELTKYISGKFKKVSESTYVLYDDADDKVLVNVSLRPSGVIDISVYKGTEEAIEDKVRKVVHNYGGNFHKVAAGETVYTIPAKMPD